MVQDQGDAHEPHRLALEILPQPDDTTCGPTCLHAVYRYFGSDCSLPQLVEQIRPLPGGGTLAVTLANHALRRGYTATIYTYNLQLFDPTWFEDSVSLAERLKAQAEVKTEHRLTIATEAYLEYLSLDGIVRLGSKISTLIRRYLQRGIPILTGLSATHLYQCAREFDNHYDSIRGEPQGHFVVLHGYDKAKRRVLVADPLRDSPAFGTHTYEMDVESLIRAIMLGVITYDANLLVLQPRGV
jgi:hypothetical protein